MGEREGDRGKQESGMRERVVEEERGWEREGGGQGEARKGDEERDGVRGKQERGMRREMELGGSRKGG